MTVYKVATGYAGCIKGIFPQPILQWDIQYGVASYNFTMTENDVNGLFSITSTMVPNHNAIPVKVSFTGIGGGERKDAAWMYYKELGTYSEYIITVIHVCV